MVEMKEYVQWLGYPAGTALEGPARQRAEAAAEWYRVHGNPRIYSVPLPEDEGVVTAITAGREVDEEIERLWAEGRIDESYFLDRYAVAVVKKLAADQGPYQLPGCGVLPFEEQFRLFSFIAALSPDLEMLPSGMLKPKHSILMLVRRTTT
jgi:hypothetical protein